VLVSGSDLRLLSAGCHHDRLRVHEVLAGNSSEMSPSHHLFSFVSCRENHFKLCSQHLLLFCPVYILLVTPTMQDSTAGPLRPALHMRDCASYQKTKLTHLLACTQEMDKNLDGKVCVTVSNNMMLHSPLFLSTHFGLSFVHANARENSPSVCLQRRILRPPSANLRLSWASRRYVPVYFQHAFLHFDVFACICLWMPLYVPSLFLPSLLLQVKSCAPSLFKVARILSAKCCMFCRHHSRLKRYHTQKCVHKSCRRVHHDHEVNTSV
jgi:hypothetical protein